MADPITTRTSQTTTSLMDVTAQDRTYQGFVRFLVWNVVAIVAVLIFMALANA